MAEPPGPGLGRARDPLAREVRLLGALLGQVIAEQAGRDRFATVERIRRRTIALRRGGPDSRFQPAAERERLARAIELRDPYVDALSAVQVELLARLRDPGRPPAEVEALRPIIGATINGIAAGLQNTG